MAQKDLSSNDILRKLSQGDKITMPEIYDEIQRKKAVKIAEKLITMGKFTLEDIAEGTGLPLETVQELAKQTAAQATFFRKTSNYLPTSRFV